MASPKEVRTLTEREYLSLAGTPEIGNQPKLDGELVEFLAQARQAIIETTGVSPEMLGSCDWGVGDQCGVVGFVGMGEKPFKVCPKCQHVWLGESDLVTDPDIRYLGKQRVLGIEAEMFTHDTLGCGTSVCVILSEGTKIEGGK